MVVFHLPAPGQLQLFVGKHVEEAHQIAVVLVALKVVGVPPDFGDHVLQTRVVCKHAVGTLKNTRQQRLFKEKPALTTKDSPVHSKWACRRTVNHSIAASYTINPITQRNTGGDLCKKQHWRTGKKGKDIYWHGFLFSVTYNILWYKRGDLGKINIAIKLQGLSQNTAKHSKKAIASINK